MDLIDTSLHTFKAVPQQEAADGNGMSLEDKRAALKKTARDFESIFMFQMVSAMRKTVPQNEGGLIKKSNGEKIFQGMLDEEWAKRLAGQGGESGLSGVIYRQLSRKMGLEEGPSVPHNAQGVPLQAADTAQLLPLNGPGSGLLKLQHSGAIRLNSKEPAGANHD